MRQYRLHMIFNNDNTITLNDNECEHIIEELRKPSTTRLNTMRVVLNLVQESGATHVSIRACRSLRCENPKYESFINKINKTLEKELNIAILLGTDTETKINLMVKRRDKALLRFTVLAILLFAYLNIAPIAVEVFKIIAYTIAGLLVFAFMSVMNASYILFNLEKKRH